MQFLYAFGAVAGAYLLGSLSFAVIVSKAFGLADPRTFGSGNPGATNVLRSGSKAAAIVTLLLDALKGWLPLALWLWLAPEAWGSRFIATTGALVGFAAFAGHLWPVFFGFKGGKGVATAAGVIFAVNPWLGLATAATWGIVAGFMRMSSLASLAAAAFAPLFYLFGDRVIWYAEKPLFAALFAISAITAWRHKANIRRLMEGTEPRIGQKAEAAPAADPKRALLSPGKKKRWQR
jgi:glycerol-3-phosphate acyltransferase PlsY